MALLYSCQRSSLSLAADAVWVLLENFSTMCLMKSRAAALMRAGCSASASPSASPSELRRTRLRSSSSASAMATPPDSSQAWPV